MRHRWETYLLALALGAYFALGLAPYRFDFSLPLVLRVDFQSTVDIFLNFLCFLPVGYLIGRLFGGCRAMLLAGVLCAAASLSVECLQAFMAHRSASLSDIAMNTLGATLGGWMAGKRDSIVRRRTGLSSR